MACVCDRCLRNANTLGVADKALSQAVLRKAFRAAARQWHPDRFENNSAQQHNAEEVFKQMHTAYRELWEHLEAPVIIELEAEPVRPAPREKPKQHTPHIFFGGLPGCYTAPNFPRFVSGLLLGLLHEQEQALGFVELSRRSTLSGPPSEFMLFTSYRIVVRDALRTVSMLWYTDLGPVRLEDTFKTGKVSWWRRWIGEIKGITEQYSLEIYRREGSLFYAFKESVDDSVKKVIYNFLRQVNV
ncbi:MAG TPA: J domain-containing protein [Terracidiphilus sp.]|nr:J domain-containing protein [Terracidiphilus sp.]